MSHRRNTSVEGGVGDCQFFEAGVGDNGSLSQLVLVTVAVFRSWCWCQWQVVAAGIGDCGSLSQLVLVTVAVCRRRNTSVEAGEW